MAFITDAFRRHRIRSAMAEVELLRMDPRVGRQEWWLSFADDRLPRGQQFMGVVIVPDCVNMADAVQQSHVAGVNPGGEVQGMPLEAPTEEYRRRLAKAPRLTLLSKADLDRLGLI